MIRKVNGQMRQTARNETSGGSPRIPLNLADTGATTSFTSPGVVGSAWTDGATLVDDINFADNVQPNRIVRIIGYSIEVELYIGVSGLGPGATEQPGYGGKWGRLIAAIHTVELTRTGTGGSKPVFYTPQFIKLPEQLDQSLVTTVWDPAVDALPPYYNTTNPPFTWTINDLAPANGLVKSAELILPQPLESYPGDILHIGLWQMPSLLFCDYSGPIPLKPQTIMTVINAKWTVSYDDGT